MRTYGEHWLKASVASKMRTAAWLDTFDGLMTVRAQRYMDAATAFHAPSGSFLIFTRDTGHHTSGWFKNAEFEQCFHLSIHFTEPFDKSQPSQFDKSLTAEWCELFFRENARNVWIESAKTPEGQSLDVLHYRLFCDEHWQPIFPRGEVYSTEFTEKGWKSWSDLHADAPEPSILYAG
jgi:hypothetical protein